MTPDATISGAMVAPFRDGCGPGQAAGARSLAAGAEWVAVASLDMLEIATAEPAQAAHRMRGHWVIRNAPHHVAVNTCQTVEAAIGWPSLTSSACTRQCSHAGFSVAMWITSLRIAGAVGGRRDGGSCSPTCARSAADARPAVSPGSPRTPHSTGGGEPAATVPPARAGHLTRNGPGRPGGARPRCGVHGRMADGVRGMRRSVRTVGVSTDGHGRAALAAFPGLTCAPESGVHPRVSPTRSA